LVFHISETEVPNADKLSSWLVAGYAAFASVIVANIDSVYNNVDKTFVLGVLALLMAHILAALVAKWCMRKIQMKERGESAIRVVERMGPAIPEGYEFDETWFRETMAQSFLPPYRWIFRRQMAKPNTGVQFAQECLRLNQLQEWSVKAQLLSILFASCLLFFGALVHQRATTETSAPATSVGRVRATATDTTDVVRPCASRSTVHRAASGCR